MIEKKSVLNTLKRAFESGALQLIGQQLREIPKELLNLQNLDISDQKWWDCNPITKIDFSNNDITVMPEEISKLLGIQSIRFKSNLLKILPVGLFSESLKLLDLSKNKLELIPKEINNATHLVELNLSNNNLTECPNISSMTHLQLLYLDNNKLNTLTQLPCNLKRFDGSSNNLSVIKRDCFWSCSGIEQIALNKNNIKEVEAGAFSKCNKLVGLEMKENKLERLDEVPTSQKLDSISLNYNRIKEFNSFTNCPNLTVLVLADNKLQSLSSEVISLKKLKTLDISNNDLSDLPSELGLLPQLVRIQLEGNPLKCIRQNIRTSGAEALKKYLKDRIATKELDQLEKKTTDPKLLFSLSSTSDSWDKLIMEFTTGNELDLRGRSLQALDKRVFKQHFRVLNVSKNSLISIQQEVGDMQQLKSLILSDNNLETLPHSLLSLRSLEQLEIKRNKLTSFFSKETSHSLHSLFLLDLTDNRLTLIPPILLLLPKLRILNVSYNKISSLEILFDKEHLHQLQVIDASNNLIEEISDNVINRITLNFLNLENNNLAKLPTVMGFMKLTGLKVEGNPLRLIKRPVIVRGTVAILEDLRNKHTGSEPVFQDPNANRESHTQPSQFSSVRQQKEKPSNQASEQPPQQKVISMKPSPKESSASLKVLVQEKNKKIGEIQEQLESNFSLNKIQKADRKRQIQQLLVERNQILQQLK